ncbi:MAG TPA: hypothetical protein VHZ97_23015 [Pseudonocardiaceae bacterium]|jgi:hypothetical protein|nr:hypothetical protein [Pseudonocardiaceae bacterium]
MFKKIKAARLVQRAGQVTPDAAWTDPELTAVKPLVVQGDLEAGWRLLVASRADHESRLLRLKTLSRAAIPHVNRLAQLSGERQDDPELALWLGTTRINQGWAVRTGKMPPHVSQEQFEEFWFILGGAHDPLMRAAELLPDDPSPWEELQWRGLGLQLERAELDEAWTEVVKRSPKLYTAHYSRGQVLCAKWQGSNEELLEFITATSTDADPGDPLAALIVAGHLEIAVNKRQSRPTYFKLPDVIGPITEIADRFMTGQTQYLRTEEAHHLFGAAFFLAGDLDRARRHLSLVNPKTMTRTLPWEYLSNQPAVYYLAARDKLGI